MPIKICRRICPPCPGLLIGRYWLCYLAHESALPHGIMPGNNCSLAEEVVWQEREISLCYSFFGVYSVKTNGPAPVRGPLGLHLNAGFTLDTLAFRLLEPSLLVTLPGEKYTVAAASRIDLGGGSQIFRYYTSGDEFLQINTTGGVDIDDIDDIKLFVYEDSFGINEERHWRSAIAPAAIGPITLDWQERRWQRFFNAEEPGNIEPVYMLEKVENQQAERWDVHNFTMGFQRQVADDTCEYLLLTGEESFNERGEPEWVFSRALGVDIPLTSLTVIG
ncbi:putative cytoplasmic protein [Salmonella bongori]|nr:putative cytoplasmic protein [Salmonella bongori]